MANISSGIRVNNKMDVFSLCTLKRWIRPSRRANKCIRCNGGTFLVSKNTLFKTVHTVHLQSIFVKHMQEFTPTLPETLDIPPPVCTV